MGPNSLPLTGFMCCVNLNFRAVIFDSNIRPLPGIIGIKRSFDKYVRSKRRAHKRSAVRRRKPPHWGYVTPYGRCEEPGEAAFFAGYIALSE